MRVLKAAKRVDVKGRTILEGGERGVFREEGESKKEKGGDEREGRIK